MKTLLLLAVSSLFFSLAQAQDDDINAQVKVLFDSFDVSQAQAFERIAEIIDNPATQTARDELQMQLKMTTTMSMSEMMASGAGHDGMQMSMTGPFNDLEVEARVALLDSMRASYSSDDASSAYEGSSALDRHTAEVFRHGRVFEKQLFAIYTDSTISNKSAAVKSAIDAYLSDDMHSVAIEPKSSDYLLIHAQATAFKSGFPLISGFLWTQQWLQLAALEAVILENLDSQFTDTINIALERFWNKVGSSGGMSMFPAPSELPMAPAIAPDLYSVAPEAAIIIDNLNVLETVVADILAYPNMEDRGEAINQAVAMFTNKDSENADPMDYLLFALRGGIYDQGGPAVGELMQSERNRSRSAMDMQHTMIMSSPQ